MVSVVPGGVLSLMLRRGAWSRKAGVLSLTSATPTASASVPVSAGAPPSRASTYSE